MTLFDFKFFILFFLIFLYSITTYSQIIDGKIISINNLAEPHEFVINLGERDGITVDANVEIYKDREKVGDGIVVKVLSDSAVVKSKDSKIWLSTTWTIKTKGKIESKKEEQKETISVQIDKETQEKINKMDLTIKEMEKKIKTIEEELEKKIMIIEELKKTKVETKPAEEKEVKKEEIKCQKCGAIIKEGSKFCPKCGVKL